MFDPRDYDGETNEGNARERQEEYYQREAEAREAAEAMELTAVQTEDALELAGFGSGRMAA